MRLIAAAIAATLILTACGGGDDDTSPTSSTSPTITTRTQTPETTTSNNTDPSPTTTPCGFYPLDIYRLEVPTGFTTTVAKGTQGTWSPNSGYFAYVVPPGNQSCGEGLNIDAAVSHQRQFVFPGFVSGWKWAPDSSSIAIATISGPDGDLPEGLNIVSVPGGETQVSLEASFSHFDWAPDSHALAFAFFDDNHLRTIDIGGDQVDLGAVVPTGAIYAIAWSPAMDRIAVMARENDDIGTARLLSVSWPDGTVTELASDPVGFNNPRFSPDGSLILYDTFVGNDDPSLYVVPADASSPPTLLAEGAFQAEWSPDGSLVAYVAGWCQSFDIAVIAPDGSGQTIVSPATEAGVQLEPTWSPDSTLIAFHSNSTYTVHPDGTNLTPVAAAMENLAFSPDGRFLTGQSLGGRGLCEGG